MTVSILIVYAYSCTKGIAFVSENDLKKFTKMAKQTLEFCISTR